MRYAMLVYGINTEAAPTSQAEREAELAAYIAFDREVSERGLLQTREALHAPHIATTVRVREGKLQTFDGPFAETKEQLGGFYLLECKDLDEAIEVAARNPGALRGSIEIRPIRELR